MPVPVWQEILDTEIDPESPITASLMQRLRDNPLALLGIAPDDPAPVMTLPPSAMFPLYRSVCTAPFNDNSLAYSNEVICSIRTAATELFHNHSGAWSANYITNSWTSVFSGNIWAIDTKYAEGSPESVDVFLSYSGRGGIAPPVSGTGTVNVPLTNTYTLLASRGGYPQNLWMKARFDADYVYAQFQTQMPNGNSGTGGALVIPYTIRGFKNKASV